MTLKALRMPLECTLDILCIPLTDVCTHFNITSRWVFLPKLKVILGQGSTFPILQRCTVPGTLRQAEIWVVLFLENVYGFASYEVSFSLLIIWSDNQERKTSTCSEVLFIHSKCTSPNLYKEFQLVVLFIWSSVNWSLNHTLDFILEHSPSYWYIFSSQK